MSDDDKLLMQIGGEIFAVDADAVVAVVETGRFFMLPMLQSSSFCPTPNFIKGVITRLGDIIVVIDIAKLFGMPSAENQRPYKVIVLKEDASSIGLLASSHLSFLWKEELAGLEFKPLKGDYIHGMIDPSGRKIRLIDWQKILEETQKIVSCR